MTLKTAITSLFIPFILSNGIAQTLIPATIRTDATLSRVERNFTGFNSGQGHFENIYKLYKANAGLEVNPNFYDVFANLSHNICWRFPGGTTANFYNRWGSGYGNGGIGQIFGDSWNYSNISTAARNSVYGDYANYNTPYFANAKSNMIFPFINSVTRNKSVGAKSIFCINIINHYRNMPFAPYDSRRETLRDTDKINDIINTQGDYLDAFNNSTLSKDFKKIVRQNLDAYLTLINNGLTVYDVEMGNEIYAYAYDDNLISDYNSFFYNNNFLYPSDTRVWFKDNGTDQSIQYTYSTLWTYARLAKLYKLLITDTLQKLAYNPQSRYSSIYEEHLNNLKFGVPISFKLDGGFNRWNNFMLQPDIKSYIGADAYVIHPYFDSSNYFKELILSPIENANEADLQTEFTNIRDTLEASYNQRFFKENQIYLINAMPEGSEVWYTEWNFNFDNNNLKKVGNTLLHAMYYYDVMMDFFDINANKNLHVACNKDNPVKQCNYQIPYAKDATWYNMTRFMKGYDAMASDPYTTTNSVANSVEYNSPYYAHLLLAPILEDSSLQYINADNGGFDPVPNCWFRTFYKKDCSSGCCKDEVYVYFDNKSDSDYVIDLRSALDITDNKCASTVMNYLYANNLYASMGQTTFRSDDFLYDQTTDSNAANVTIQRVFNRQMPQSALSVLKIPKYSLGNIRVEISLPGTICSCGAGDKTKNTEMFVARLSNSGELSNALTNESAVAAMSLYPNPSRGDVNLSIHAPKESASVISIFDINGNLVRSIPQDLNEGENSIALDLNDMAKGAYLLKLSGEQLDISKKVVLQ